METISINQAWANAASFFKVDMASHATALIGVGVLVPLLIQFALTGATGGSPMDTSGMAGADGFGAMGAIGVTIFLLFFVNFILQQGSYFASTRIGLAPGQESIGSALGYGLVAALPTLLLMIVFILILMIPLGLIFGAAFFPMFAGEAEPDSAALIRSMSGLLLLLPLLFILFLWLAARFCCMVPVMADRRSFNVLTGLAESWRMTSASQWKLMGYFLLVGIALVVIVMLFTMVAGVSMLAGGGVSGTGSFIGFTIVSLLFGIPSAYLQVGIPAGIYQALGKSNVSEVFA